MFFYDKRFLYLILGVFVITGLMGMTQSGILSLLFTLPGVLIAITFHEFAHAYAATKLGDDTPEAQGRLNLNPISHMDPIGFILLLFAGFGWGKPVEINPKNFDRKYSMTAGEAIVAVAGPIMNFILAIVFALIYASMYKFAYSFIQTNVRSNNMDYNLKCNHNKPWTWSIQSNTTTTTRRIKSINELLTI